MNQKIQSSSIFLDKINSLQRYSTDQKIYNDIKNEYCQDGKQGLFRIFENKKRRQIGILYASQEGDIQILKKWVQYHQQKKNSKSYMRRDVEKKWVQFIINNENKRSLEWWYKNERDILDQYISEIQIEGCRQEKLDILDWCKQKNDIEWEEICLENLPKEKIVQTLNWWYENKQWTKLKYREQVIDNICQYCETDQLQWFHDMRGDIEMKYSTLAVQNACKQGNINVLNWWYYMQNDIKMKYDEQAIEQACKNRKNNIVRWWISRVDLELKYNKENQYIDQYINILKQNKYKESNENEICQICHEILTFKQVFECQKCKKQIHENCYKQLKKKQIKECPNCKSMFFI